MSRSLSLGRARSTNSLSTNGNYEDSVSVGGSSASGLMSASDLIAKRSQVKQQRPATPSKRSSNMSVNQLSKVGRVKVGVRCRPPFQDEIDFAKGNFFPIVSCTAESVNDTNTSQNYARVTLTLLNGNQRDFLYDYSFDMNSSQDQVFDKIARPIVVDVLKGFNGTIFAYGQTGTGKTYTMGILDSVKNEHAGIIPRSLAQIFQYVEQNSLNTEIIITVSFLQLYREMIQDLLAPANTTWTANNIDETNLNVREDPLRGFYVDGLQEFIVKSYSEAEALVNLGLENRTIAPTLMNSTSSRSHTILTVNIEQRGKLNTSTQKEGSVSGSVSKQKDNNNSNNLGGLTKCLRSKLLMVDLAGSERVRRTVSKGDRLSEAKSINTSLSALGNVIAALADSNSPHIPYRDSKLTRLLQDSLGGTASTAMIATIGPAAVNYNETLSTLVFATRCMAVKSTPVLHEEVDYAEMCARLQEKLSLIEGQYTHKLLEQQKKHEAVLKEMGISSSNAKTNGATYLDNHQFNSIQLLSLDKILSLLESIRQGKSPDMKNKHWLSPEAVHDPSELITLFAYSYELIRAFTDEITSMLRENLTRDDVNRENWLVQITHEQELDSIRDKERAGMQENDSSNSQSSVSKPHLAPISRIDIYKSVGDKHSSNNIPISQNDNNFEISTLSENIMHLTDFKSPEELAVSMSEAHGVIYKNLRSIAILMSRKDEHYRTLREELATEKIERRKREEEVINWSYILKHLLATISKLRKQLSVETDVAGGGVKLLAHLVNTNNSNHSVRSSPTTTTTTKVSSTNPFADDYDNNNEGKSQLEHELSSSTSKSVRSQSNKSNRMNYERLNTFKFTSDVTDPRRKAIQDNMGNLDNTKPNFLAPRSVEPSPLERIQLKSDAINNNNNSTTTTKNKFSFIQNNSSFTSEVDQLGPPSDNSSNGTTTQFEDNNYNRLSPNNTTNRLETSSEAHLSETFKSEITLSSWRSKNKNKNKINNNNINDIYNDSNVKSSTTKSKGKKVAPSQTAHDMILQLGVKGEEASAAMAVVDQLLSLTDTEINSMDPGFQTKLQVLQMRRDLGITTAESRPIDAFKGLNNPMMNNSRSRSANIPHPSSSAAASSAAAAAAAAAAHSSSNSKSIRQKDHSFNLDNQIRSQSSNRLSTGNTKTNKNMLDNNSNSAYKSEPHNLINNLRDNTNTRQPNGYSSSSSSQTPQVRKTSLMDKANKGRIKYSQIDDIED